MKDGRTARGERTFEGWDELFRALHTLTVTVESLGKNRKIRDS